MSSVPDREPEPSKLSNEWERQQTKTFTAWVNSHLSKRDMKIEDIARDLSDGRKLLALLEIIADETLPKPSRGTMKIHHVENVGRALRFIQDKNVDVRSIAPEEVVDHNLKMILGLTWMLILRFEIQDISEDQLNAKDALLLWCQRKTEGYSNVDVQNFHMSWKDGLAFCALIHRHRPDLIDYDKLSKGNARENLNTAFDVAERELGIPKLLDAEDMVNCIKPDERSVMTYVAKYYKCFASFNQVRGGSFFPFNTTLPSQVPHSTSHTQQSKKKKEKQQTHSLTSHPSLTPSLPHSLDTHTLTLSPSPPHFFTPSLTHSLPRSLTLSPSPPHTLTHPLLHQAETAAKKIATVLETNREHERLIAQYETMATDLLAWIEQTIAWLADRPAIHDVQTCTDKIETINKFRSEELPTKLEERAVLEEHYSTLQTKLRLSGRPPFVASESKEISDVVAAWERLEAADSEHLRWVLDELKRVRQAEAKAALFTSKADAHEAWTSGKDAQLQADDYSGANLATVSALLKKHQAFQSDLTAHEQRVHEIGTLANELDDLKYVNADAVNDRYAAIYENWQTLVQLTQDRHQKLTEAEASARHLDGLFLEFAQQAPPFSNFIELAKEKLTEPYVVETEEETETLRSDYNKFTESVPEFQTAFEALTELNKDMSEHGSTENPYSPHSFDALAEGWQQVQELVAQRATELSAEADKQASREALRTKWAAAAKESQEWLTARDAEIKDTFTATTYDKLEDQIATLQQVEASVEEYKPQMEALEQIHKETRDNLIFDNQHTNITMEVLRGKYSAIKSSISRAINELNNQILARDSTNITEEEMKEYKESFMHWDKDRSGFLEHKEFRAFLLSLGKFAISQVPDEEGDEEWERIIKRLDPNGDGKVSFDEFIAFMVEESADAESADQLLEAFRVLSNGQQYVLASDLQRELSPELYEYCVQNMSPYEGGPEGALDYSSFANALYGESDL